MNAHSLRRLLWGLRIRIAICTIALIAAATDAPAAVIGVLSDGRQFPELSPLDPGSAIAITLQARGHTITPLGPGALLLPVDLASVDIMWLPRLGPSETYSTEEVDSLAQFAVDGGRLIWFGDAFVSGDAPPDANLLAAFGLGMRFGSFGETLAPALQTHPIITGPNGQISAIGTSAGYGLLDTPTDAADLFIHPLDSGSLIASLDAGSGWSGSGRVAFVADSTMFRDLLEQDDHEPLLLNMIDWLERASEYTPSGSNVTVGPLSDACEACTEIAVQFAAVDQTGMTGVSPLGSGRCGFAAVPFASLPANFLGYGFDLQTTASISPGATLTITIHYDSQVLADLGIADPLDLTIYEAGDFPITAVSSPTDVNTAAQTVTGIAGGSGTFLFGALVSVTNDCNDNGLPDSCEILEGDVPDCNENGSPDSCDIEFGGSADCNNNGIPDECDARIIFSADSGILSPIGADSPQVFVITSAPPAAGDVVLDFTASADLSVPLEFIEVSINGTAIGSIFESGAADCPIDPDREQLVVPAATFNSLVTDGQAAIEMTPTSTVNSTLCDAGSFVQVVIRYEGNSASADCNRNGIPDECESAADCNTNGIRDICEIADDPSLDCNDNGIPDGCDVAAGSADCNANNVPDECEPTVNLTLAVDPPSGGSVQFNPASDGTHDLCSIIGIGATPADGYCFSGWTVDAGALPADPFSATTTIAANESKTVTASFILVIVEQPMNVGICQGMLTSFSVQVHDDLLAGAAYQWQYDDGNGPADLDDVAGAISGTTQPELALSSVGLGDVGAYRCIVTHACGVVVSDAAELIVRDDVSIINGPEDQSACPGDTVRFEVGAAGAEPTYQWEADTGEGFFPLGDSQTVSGSGTPVLQISNVSEAADGQYRCLVSGSCGPAILTDPASLFVGQGPAVTSNPVDQSACVGDAVSFTVAAVGTDLGYQWWFDDGSGPQPVSGAGISGADSATLTIADVGEAHGGSYSCILMGACPTSVETTPAELIVNTSPEIVVEPPVEQTVCPGGSVSFDVQAAGTDLVYQWQFDDLGGSGFSTILDSAEVIGAQAAMLSMQNISASDAGRYRCLISGACGAEIESASAELLVEIDAELTNQPIDASACPGDSIIFQVAAVGSELTYQWQFDPGTAFQNLVDETDAISGTTTNTLVISNVTESDAGLYQCIIVGSCGAAVTSEAAQLAVDVGQCDCNSNGRPDEADLADATSLDCNGNLMPDECDLSSGVSTDCNGNLRPDECDLASEEDTDCNGNGLPDQCELDGQDCNSDGTLDACQIDGNDCNGNAVLDECEPVYFADAGPDIVLCVDQVSLSLGGAVVADGSSPPYLYEWSVLSGPQGGDQLLAADDERARFIATAPGTYEIQLEVSDSSSPPCVVVDTLVATVHDFAVDAGPEFTMCEMATSDSLSPQVAGGIGPFLYRWFIEEDGPSTDPLQFTGSGPDSENPNFTPDRPGRYTLGLIVTDESNPSCTRTDTLVIEVRSMAIELPTDFNMCLGAQSRSLDVTITSPGLPPYTYSWSIDPSSPDTAIAQFAGEGPLSANPIFVPTTQGNYELLVTVQGSSTPPCEQSATIRIGVGTMSVDAGSQIAQCVGAEGVRLSPAIEGGHGNITYAWSIDPASPNLDEGQFIDPHPFDPAPLFVPSAVGTYTLRLAVTDSASPPCTATDTVIIRATSMTVDAGADFVTQAFEPAQPLGAAQIVTGGDPPFDYDWEILVGPDVSPSQLSAAGTARPVFTPSAVGTYTLRVTATDDNGAGCSISDRVIIEAVATAITMTVNTEGRLFMNLRIGEPHASAEFRLAQAAPGAQVSGELMEEGSAASFVGLIPTPGLTRRLNIDSELLPGSYVALVTMRYTIDELVDLGGVDPQIQWWQARLGFWQPAALGMLEEGQPPARPTTNDLGRQGIDRLRNAVWAIVDHMGQFSIGVSTGESPTPSLFGSNTDNTDNTTPADLPSALCGVLGGGMFLPLMLTTLVRARRRRANRLRPSA